MLRFVATRPIKHAVRMISTNIKLDATESKICSLLVDYARYYEGKHNQKLVLRITGGWVRDKLLGQESHDLDIAIDKLTGLQFAEGLNEYIGQNESLGIAPHSIHTIERNPDKSKHLETATTKLDGIELDFVNLRSEEYTDNSRIPTFKFGTPEEDAKRRDATLNALFYNLMDRKVEDFTKEGLRDLEDGILRTPLPSFETFNEDPLRVLRLLRFASCFGFSVAEEALEAMADERIKAAFAKKISRERVGVEIGKMLAGKYPQAGLKFIEELRLESLIFGLPNPNNLGLKEEPKSSLGLAVNAVQAIIASNPPVISEIFSDKHLSTLVWSLAPLSRWKDVQAVEKGKPVAASFIIVREGLKWSTADAKLIEKAMAAENKITESLSATDRLTLGKLVRLCGEHWRIAFIYSIIFRHTQGEDLDQLCEAYASLASRIVHNGLDQAWEWRPLVNGKEISKYFGVQPGKWMSPVTERCIEFQISNPDATKEECLEYLFSVKGEFIP